MDKINKLVVAGIIVLVIIVLLAILYKTPVKEKIVVTCDKLIDKVARDKCLNVKDETLLDESLQKVKQDYSGASIADMKLLSKALRMKDKSLCERIVDNYTKDKCVNS